MFEKVSLQESRLHLKVLARQDAVIALCAAGTIPFILTFTAFGTLIIGFTLSLLFMSKLTECEKSTVKSVTGSRKGMLFRKSKGQNFAFNLPIFSIVGIGQKTLTNIKTKKERASIFHELGHIGSWDIAVIFLLSFTAIAFLFNAVNSLIISSGGCLPPPPMWRSYVETSLPTRFGQNSTNSTIILAVMSAAFFMGLASKRFRNQMRQRPPHEIAMILVLMFMLFVLVGGNIDTIDYSLALCRTQHGVELLASTGQSFENYLNGTIYFTVLRFLYGIAVLVVLTRVIHRREIYADVNAAHLSANIRVNEDRFLSPSWMPKDIVETPVVRIFNRILQPSIPLRRKVLQTGYELRTQRYFLSSCSVSFILAQFLYMQTFASNLYPDRAINGFEGSFFVVTAIAIIWHHTKSLTELLSTRKHAHWIAHLFGSSIGYACGFGVIYFTLTKLLGRSDVSSLSYWIIPTLTLVSLLTLVVLFAAFVFRRRNTVFSNGVIFVVSLFYIAAVFGNYGNSTSEVIQSVSAYLSAFLFCLIVFGLAVILRLVVTVALLLKVRSTRRSN